MHLATINRYTVALSPADLGIINLFIVLRLLQVNGAKNCSLVVVIFKIEFIGVTQAS